MGKNWDGVLQWGLVRENFQCSGHPLLIPGQDSWKPLQKLNLDPWSLKTERDQYLSPACGRLKGRNCGFKGPQPGTKVILLLCWKQTALLMTTGQRLEFPCGSSVTPTEGGPAGVILKWTPSKTAQRAPRFQQKGRPSKAHWLRGDLKITVEGEWLIVRSSEWGIAKESVRVVAKFLSTMLKVLMSYGY